jgi:hypothetical protein
MGICVIHFFPDVEKNVSGGFTLQNCFSACCTLSLNMESLARMEISGREITVGHGDVDSGVTDI